MQIVKHFEHAYNAENESGIPAVTRCMVFCSFREGVTEIVVGNKIQCSLFKLTLARSSLAGYTQRSQAFDKSP